MKTRPIIIVQSVPRQTTVHVITGLSSVLFSGQEEDRERVVCLGRVHAKWTKICQERYYVYIGKGVYGTIAAADATNTNQKHKNFARTI